MLQSILRSTQDVFASPRSVCQPQARFSRKIDVQIGSFIHDGEVILFEKNQHFHEVPAEPPMGCIVKVGSGSAEYLMGPVGGVFAIKSQ